MRLLPATAYRRMPWKNGGGETTEIAVSPETATLDDFDWRVSMARVDVPGSFSQFPGVDRTLAVLDGNELVLRFSPEQTATLTPASEPLAFRADVPVEADLPAGGITDLNVMTRRGRVRHQVRRLMLHAPTSLTCRGDEMLLLAHAGDVVVRANASEVKVAAGETVVSDELADSSFAVVPQGSATLFLVTFWRQ